MRAVLFFLMFMHALLAEAGGYAEIDARALSAPGESEASVPKLAAFLTGGVRSDEEKARAIYRWVTDRIDYDAEAYFRNELRNRDAGEVLASRKSVCSGYAELFEALGRAAGLEVVTIRGYAKGYGHVRGKIFDRPNHDWNAVRIDGKWRFVDSTWGAGYLRDGRYIRAYSERFFLASPEEFIFSHLPLDDAWQIQSTPHVGKAEFEALPLPGEAFFNLGISGEAAWESMQDSNGEFVHTFDTPYREVRILDAPLAFRLTPGKFQHWAVESAAFEKMAVVYENRWIGMERHASVFEAGITPGRSGDLLVYGKKPGERDYEAVLAYVVN